MRKPKVIISTDIGGNDKDDAQSFVHALLYSNDIDYRGFIETRTDDRGKGGDGTSILKRVISEYGDDLSDLRSVDRDFPSESYLRSLIKEGSSNPNWPGSLSQGAKHIISEARDASSSDPLYVLTWGPIHDAAAALRAAPDIAPNVRLISIAGLNQDKANPEAYKWLTSAVKNDSDFKNLWWVDSAETFRGMYVGSKGQNDPSKHLNWVKSNVKGHGDLGDLFYNEYTFDLYGKNSPDGLKMGDTPSLLYLLDGANNNDPTASSWGGTFKKSGLGPNTWVDRTDSGSKLGKYDGAKTVYKHRDKIFDDFAERLDWAKGSGKSSQSDNKDVASDSDTGSKSSGSGSKSSGGSSSGSGSSSSSKSSGDLPEIVVGANQIEKLDLDGYSVQSHGPAKGGKIVTTRSKGEASGIFDGPSGVYDVTTRFLNEDDGQAAWDILVDTKEVFGWSGRGGSGNYETVTKRIDLDRGDEITLVGTKGGGEYARLDQIEIKAVNGQSYSSDSSSKSSNKSSDSDSSSKSSGGSKSSSSSGPSIKSGRSEIEDWDLSGYSERDVRKASGSELVETRSSGKATAVYEGKSTATKVKIGFLNEDDGRSIYELLVDNKEVFSWRGDGGKNNYESVTANVKIKPGSTVTLTGAKDGGEYARLDYFEILANDAG